jgi:organic hydroperoxide reductase OsmC/OhrA
MTGTFAGALRPRGSDPTGLVGHARGEVELDGKVLVIRRIHFSYTGVEIPEEKRDSAERALATHHRSCPVSRSIEACIEITAGWG